MLLLIFSKVNPGPYPQLLPMWEAPPKRIFIAVSQSYYSTVQLCNTGFKNFILKEQKNPKKTPAPPPQKKTNPKQTKKITHKKTPLNVEATFISII